MRAGKHPSHGWCGERMVIGKLGTSLQGPEYREASSPYFPWFTDTLTQVPSHPVCPGHLGAGGATLTQVPPDPICPEHLGAGGARKPHRRRMPWPRAGGVVAFSAQCLGELCQATPRVGVVGVHSRHRSTVLDVAAA